MDSHRRIAAGCVFGSVSNMRRRILILGGTTEARELAGILAGRDDLETTLSLAGRTAVPAAQPVPMRRGGFGGAAGLADYLRVPLVHCLIDATHPYAARISANAAEAAARTRTPILALRRPPWEMAAGDRWVEVNDACDAIRQLGAPPKRIFLAIGRQELAPFGAAPQHHYLIRSVDPIEPPLDLPHARYIQARGPFTEREDRALLLENAIDVIVAKNSGGASTYGKIAAARSIGIPVMLFRRPPAPDVPSVSTTQEAVAWLDHVLVRTPRGV
jgi:precorrin-6A/cobalt-precorrin-6A reductase